MVSLLITKSKTSKFSASDDCLMNYCLANNILLSIIFCFDYFYLFSATTCVVTTAEKNFIVVVT